MTQHEPVLLDYAARGARPPRRAPFTLLELLVVLGIVGVLIGILLPALSNREHPSTTVRCMSNLRTIGQYMALYVSAERAYPDRVGTLFEYAQRLSPKDPRLAQYFVCPKSGPAAASGATTQAVRSDFAIGPKTAFTCLADRVPPQSRADVVVMIESAGNHNGIHTALFADGHVSTLSAAAGTAVLQQAAAGIRPVVWPPPSSATTQPAR